jgi:hypothetical protein
LWQDVHEIVSSSPGHLASEFKEYLEALGLGKLDWAGLGNPFVDDTAAQELRSIYDGLAPLFSGRGVSCRKRDNSLVYEIRRPFPPIHLINVSPIASVADWDRRLWGPVMAMSVWVRRDGDPSQRVLPPGKGHVRGSDPKVFITDTVPVRPARYDQRLHLEREYYLPLEAILRESKAASQERLLAFIQTAIDHLQGRRVLEAQQDA